MWLLFTKAHAFGFLHLNLGCRDAPIQIQSLHSCTTPNVQWCNCRARLHLCPVGDLRSVSLACSVTKALPRMLWRRQVAGHNNLSFSVAWPSWLPFCLFYFPSDWKCPVEYSENKKNPKTIKTKKNTLLLCLLLRTETILQQAKSQRKWDINLYQTALIVAGVCHIHRLWFILFDRILFALKRSYFFNNYWVISVWTKWWTKRMNDVSIFRKTMLLWPKTFQKKKKKPTTLNVF